MLNDSNGNSYNGSGFLAPAEDRRVRSLPWVFRLGVPGFAGGWPCR